MNDLTCIEALKEVANFKEANPFNGSYIIPFANGLLHRVADDEKERYRELVSEIFGS